MESQSVLFLSVAVVVVRQSWVAASVDDAGAILEDVDTVVVVANVCSSISSCGVRQSCG